jgi:alkanesulfonate monooxygenase SsuD/methylene tetrahydromethanopterin reductase-like flavin-dependent oxidoreductase (luciferase family)
MKYGLHGVNLNTCGYPDAAARLGRAAEAAGFESLWVADHVVLPDPPVEGRPMAPDMRLLDPPLSDAGRPGAPGAAATARANGQVRHMRAAFSQSRWSCCISVQMKS